MISLAITIYLISWLKTTCVHVLNTWSFHNILIKSLVLEIKPYIIDTQCIVTFLNNSISLISFIVLRTELKMASWNAHISIGHSNIIYTLIICKWALIQMVLIYLLINLLSILTGMDDLDSRRIRGCTCIRNFWKCRNEIMKINYLQLINSFLLRNGRTFVWTGWITSIDNYILIILTRDLTFPAWMLGA